MMNLGYVLCGSFCTIGKSIEIMEKLSKEYNIIPVMSENAYNIDTRFGKATDIQKRIEDICGNKIIHTIVDAEPLGPKKMVDMLLVAPCTGNTLSKVSMGITDTTATMAIKSTLRIGVPVVLSIASNDALSASAKNIGVLLNTKHIYFVPFKQDDSNLKPTSLVANMDLIPKTLELAKEKRQIQPIIL